jgi:hypothetical protein
MTSSERQAARERLLSWTAGLGAITAEALALREGRTVASARATLAAAVRAGQLERHSPLAGEPSLYTVTRCGLRAVSLRELGPARVGPASARHMTVCAEAAALLERRYADCAVVGERALRELERRAGKPLASVELGYAGASTVHRPDMLLLPPSFERGLPVAVEVELTVKAPQRLARICRAWARSRHLEGVLYLAPPDVERAVLRAVEAARAGERVLVLPFDAIR